MADGVVVVQPDSSGKKIDTTELTVGANTVERQRVQLAGAAAGDLVNVDPTLGALRVATRPMEALGYYSVATRTPTYGGQAALAPLVALRNPSSTVLIVVLRVRVSVATTTAATAAGGVARELIIGRSWSVSDTGTAITLTTNANSAKRRTSMATSIADLKHAGPLTAGTRTLDPNALSQAVGWLGLTTTGMTLSASPNNFGTSTAGTNVALGGQGVMLLDALSGGEMPIVLAQNEGALIRIGPDAEPTSAVQQTYWEITWSEVTAATF